MGIPSDLRPRRRRRFRQRRQGQGRAVSSHSPQDSVADFLERKPPIRIIHIALGTLPSHTIHQGAFQISRCRSRLPPWYDAVDSGGSSTCHYQALLLPSLPQLYL